MNCLLLRELSLQLVIRIWDTYFSELETFAVLHVYVCAAFMSKFSEQLKSLELENIMMFLKEPPTTDWTMDDIEMLLSQA
jgi:hypothetical protein